MAPTKSKKRPRSSLSTWQASMKLRSGPTSRRAIEQEASSRINPQAATPTKRKCRPKKQCIFVDDEAEVEEDSNNLNDEIEATSMCVSCASLLIIVIKLSRIIVCNVFCFTQVNK